MLAIHQIEHPFQKLDIVRELFTEYVEELDEDLNFQKFEDEIKDPLDKYGPPDGCLLVAYWYNEPAGCIALQRLPGDQLCEMKRLYVKPVYREHGIGDDLIKKLLEVAKENGYTYVFPREALLVMPPGDDLASLVRKKLNIKATAVPKTLPAK